MASFNSATVADQLTDCVNAAGARPLSRAEIEEIIRSAMMNATTEPQVPPPVRLYGELGALARYIQQARSEIAALRPDEISSKHIPSATDELDAVVGATERATGQILDACEKVEAVSGNVDAGASAALVDAVTCIYEACSFQDITGQRITKVVKTLKHIEEQVSKLLEAFGEELAKTEQGAQDVNASGDAMSDSALLNGPQLPGRGVDQAEIDRLLASFD